MSLPEVLLWQQLRSNRLGARFRKQHSIGPYVVDFYCAAARLVIEVDGEAHNRADRPNRDAERDHFIIENGYRLLRIRAQDLLSDMEAVIRSIASHVANPLHQPAAGPPPRTGEDFAKELPCLSS